MGRLPLLIGGFELDRSAAVNVVVYQFGSKLQGEYEQEGVAVKHVGYEDNRPLLELLLTVSDSKINGGVWNL